MSTTNYWYDAKCAKAFWSQGELPAYKRLLADTLDWLDPLPGQVWLDLGCGAGRVARELWNKAQGRLGGIIGLDVAVANRKALAQLADELGTDRIDFHHGDLSQGLPGFADNSLDGVVSGLAVQYAEHYCPKAGHWTRAAYELLLVDVCRALKPGGTFVFSVNIPRPNWYKLTLGGVFGFFRSGRPVKYVKNTFRMLRYGAWLKREASSGRFHYLPEETVRGCLTQAGFTNIEVRRSFANLAYIFRARKPS